MQRWDHEPEKPAMCILRTESIGDFYHHADSGNWAPNANEPFYTESSCWPNIFLIFTIFDNI